MPIIEVKSNARARIKKLRDTLDITENYEKQKTKKAEFFDMMFDIYQRDDTDIGKKKELLYLLISKIHHGGTE